MAIPQELVDLRVHPQWPFNMLRIRAAPAADADVIETIPPEAFAEMNFIGYDAGDFWSIDRPTGQGYVIKVYEGHHTLFPVRQESGAEGGDESATDAPILKKILCREGALMKEPVGPKICVQVRTITGDPIFGPTAVSCSMTVAQFKQKLRMETPAWTASDFELVFGDVVLGDTDSFGDDSHGDLVTLTYVQLYVDFEDALERWRVLASSAPIRHVAYGDGGMVAMRLEFQSPFVQTAPDRHPDQDTFDGDALSVAELREMIARWPFADGIHSRRREPDAPSLASSLEEVAATVEKYSMSLFCRGRPVWGPRLDCWLQKGDWTLPLAIHQHVRGCDLD